jgi:hypothetical protein
VERGKTRKEAMFWSQHRKKIWHCDACRDDLNDLEGNLGLYGHRYDLLETQPDGQSFYRLKVDKLTLRVGKMTSLKQRAIYANLHAKAIAGIAVRHLTQAEIAAQYTPEYIETLLARAEQKAQAMYSGLWEVKCL